MEQEKISADPLTLRQIITAEVTSNISPSSQVGEGQNSSLCTDSRLTTDFSAAQVLEKHQGETEVTPHSLSVVLRVLEAVQQS